MQLMLLEQQNKRRLMQARQEQDESRAIDAMRNLQAKRSRNHNTTSPTTSQSSTPSSDSTIRAGAYANNTEADSSESFATRLTSSAANLTRSFLSPGDAAQVFSSAGGGVSKASSSSSTSNLFQVTGRPTEAAYADQASIIARDHRANDPLPFAESFRSAYTSALAGGAGWDEANLDGEVAAFQGPGRANEPAFTSTPFFDYLASEAHSGDSKGKGKAVVTRYDDSNDRNDETEESQGAAWAAQFRSEGPDLQYSHSSVSCNPYADLRSSRDVVAVQARDGAEVLALLQSSNNAPRAMSEAEKLAEFDTEYQDHGDVSAESLFPTTIDTTTVGIASINSNGAENDKASIIEKYKSSLPIPLTSPLQRTSVSPTNPLALHPDPSALADTASDLLPSSSISAMINAEAAKARKTWLKQWDDVVSNYMDVVWGDREHSAEDDKWLKEGESAASDLKNKDVDVQRQEKAVERLRMVLRHFRGV